MLKQNEFETLGAADDMGAGSERQSNLIVSRPNPQEMLKVLKSEGLKYRSETWVYIKK